MKQSYTIKIHFDTRREKKSGKYPVKLRVYVKQLKKRCDYPTKFEFTKQEFKSIWETTKPKEKYKDLRLQLQAIENKANETAKLIEPFSFEKFEKKLHLKTGEGENVFFHYNEIINKNKNKGRIGNAISYEYSFKSIKNYIKYKKGSDYENLKFVEIDKDWLEDYQYYMVDTLERSYSTVGIFLRSLRAVFNKAINDNEIPAEIHPFGKGKYEIPEADKAKKVLSKEQIKQLFESIPRTPEQEKAKDFWFFSYACNGINIKDIVLLKYKDLSDKKFSYYRAKTINTKRKKILIEVYLNEYILSIIEKYGNKDKSPKNYIFSVIEDNQNEEDKHRKIKNFTKFINQNIKKLAIAEGLPSEISTYWARHSFATMAIRNGKSLEFVGEAFSHSDKKTTQNYFAGFEDDVKKEFAQNIMNF
ncbi:MAG: site-specific integrase [Bacteroidales bacterium]|nr:site-specific integrase [Bacteroidales bacterium]